MAGDGDEYEEDDTDFEGEDPEKRGDGPPFPKNQEGERGGEPNPEQDDEGEPSERRNTGSFPDARTVNRSPGKSDGRPSYPRAAGRVQAVSDSDRRRESVQGRERQEPRSREKRDSRSHEGSLELEDPVKDAHEGQVDLYDIATWEVRSVLDTFSVRLTKALRTTRGSLLLAVAVSLFIGQLAVAGIVIVEQPILGVLALVSVLPAAALAGYFWYGDPTVREPPRLLAITFLLAVLFASFAAVVNTIFLPGFELLGPIGLVLFYFLVVGPVEETVKWLAVRVHAYKSASFQTVVDGAVYGAVAGVGFAAIENLIYIVSVVVFADQAGPIVQQQYAVAGIRALVGPGHVIFSAWAGFYLGLAKFNPDHRGPIVVKGLLIAAFIHALYNTLVGFVPSTQVFVLFLLVYHGFWFTLLWKKIARYQELYQRIRPPPGGPTQQSGAETTHPQQRTAPGDRSQLSSSGDNRTEPQQPE